MSIHKKYHTYILLGAILVMGLAVSMLFGNLVVEAASTHSATNKNILIIYTGGTIGMVNTPDGLKNEPGKGTQQLDKYLSLYPDHKDKIGKYEILSYDPLIDSSNMNPSDWNKMIKTIRDNYSQYDAFLIMHGTDTMAYTASALSFALKGLGKPVVVTGAQEPLAKLRNDGINNLITSLLYCSRGDALSEVVLIFDNIVFRGNRSKKLSPNKNDAFGSPNFPPLGKFGIGFEYNIVVNQDTRQPVTKYQRYWQYQQNVLEATLYKESNLNVIVVTLTPGINFDHYTDIVRNSSVSAFVLQTFGIGNGPDGNKSFQKFLQACQAANVPVYNISQCSQGRVEQGDYATGSFLTKMNVVSGSDMTLEAAFTKACFLASIYPNSPDEQRNMFKRDFVGEMTSEDMNDFELFIPIQS
jgi:L-asparaginase